MNGKEELERKQKINQYNEEYGYDFVATLAHFTNIDEQRDKAKDMERMGRKKKNSR